MVILYYCQFLCQIPFDPLSGNIVVGGYKIIRLESAVSEAEENVDRGQFDTGYIFYWKLLN